MFSVVPQLSMSKFALDLHVLWHAEWPDLHMARSSSPGQSQLLFFTFEDAK
jgi:hypothetical protein